MGDRRFSGTFLKLGKPDNRMAASDGKASPTPAPEISAVTSAGIEQALHYRIQTKLGEGGMGIVYEAIDQKLNRRVALKFLPPQIKHSSVDVQRFLQEANALSALNHPHIATIYALESAGEQEFLVLEHLPGGTLKAKVQQAYGSGGKLSIDEVLRYVQQTAEGLAHAHARGIIHRDVKTSNLMLTAEGDVKITDFGVAKLAGSSLKTIPGSLLGTIAYMSPEQALGVEVDPRSDVFSLGVVLFELITGHLPFEAPNDAALLTKVANPRAPELKAFRADVPAELERIVGRALKKRLGERYGTMAEMLADIQAARARTSHQTRLSTRKEIQTTAIPPRSAWRFAAVVGAGAMVLVAGLFFARRQFFRAVPAQQSAASGKVAGEHAQNRLMVLPFTIVGHPEANEGFYEKLITELPEELAKFEQLHHSLTIVNQTEVLKKNITSAQEAMSMFDARLVSTEKDRPTLLLTGTVIEDEGLIVTAILHDAQRRIVLNSIDFDTPIDRAPSLHQGLAKKVAEMLHHQVSETSDARQHLLRARGYLERYDRRDNLENAIAAFDQALLQDKSNVVAKAGKAEAYLRMYDLTRDEAFLDRARENVRAAWELDNQVASVHFAKGLLRVAMGDHEGAIESFQHSLKIEGRPDVTRELANSYDALDRVELAEEAYRQAIQMRRGGWVGYKDLGVFYQRHGRLKDALPLFQRVVRLAPDDYSSYTNLGGVYSKLRRYAEASTTYQLALRIDPSPRSYYALGTSQFLSHRYPDAVEAYQRAVELNQTEGLYWGALGDACRCVTGMADCAVEAYRKAVALKEVELSARPRDARIRAKIASWSTLSNRGRALREIRRALQLKRRDPLVQAMAVSVYEQLDMRKEALAALAEAVKLGYAAVELQNWPTLEKLRQDPRYKRIVPVSIEGVTVTTSSN